MELDKDYQKSLSDTVNKSQDDFEKQLSFISAGALGLSMLFIEKLVPLQSATNKPLLIIGWVLLAITLFANLISHLLSAQYNYKTLVEYQENEETRHHDRTKWIIRINWGTIFTLITGILLILIFTSINILTMAKETKIQIPPKEEKLGRIVPPPPKTPANNTPQTQPTTPNPPPTNQGNNNP